MQRSPARRGLFHLPQELPRPLAAFLLWGQRAKSTSSLGRQKEPRRLSPGTPLNGHCCLQMLEKGAASAAVKVAARSLGKLTDRPRNRGLGGLGFVYSLLCWVSGCNAPAGVSNAVCIKKDHNPLNEPGERARLSNRMLHSEGQRRG